MPNALKGVRSFSSEITWPTPSNSQTSRKQNEVIPMDYDVILGNVHSSTEFPGARFFFFFSPVDYFRYFQ